MFARLFITAVLLLAVFWASQQVFLAAGEEWGWGNPELISYLIASIATLVVTPSMYLFAKGLTGRDLEEVKRDMERVRLSLKILEQSEEVDKEEFVRLVERFNFNAIRLGLLQYNITKEELR